LPARHSLPPGDTLSRLDHKNPQSLFVYGLRSIGQALLAPYAGEFRGLSTCGYPHPFLLPAGEAVPIYLEVIPSEGGAEEVAAYAAGITTCGSPWACPVCSPALGHRRGEALARALERLQGMGYRIAHGPAHPGGLPGHAPAGPLGCLAAGGWPSPGEEALGWRGLVPVGGGDVWPAWVASAPPSGRRRPPGAGSLGLEGAGGCLAGGSGGP